MRAPHPRALDRTACRPSTVPPLGTAPLQTLAPLAEVAIALWRFPTCTWCPTQVGIWRAGGGCILSDEALSAGGGVRAGPTMPHQQSANILHLYNNSMYGEYRRPHLPPMHTWFSKPIATLRLVRLIRHCRLISARYIETVVKPSAEIFHAMKNCSPLTGRPVTCHDKGYPLSCAGAPTLSLGLEKDC